MIVGRLSGSRVVNERGEENCIADTSQGKTETKKKKRPSHRIGLAVCIVKWRPSKRVASKQPWYLVVGIDGVRVIATAFKSWTLDQ